MFWGLGGGGKSTVPPATSHAETSRWSSQNGQIAANPSVPIAPLYILSEQRRNELLLAARTNRVSWVDGVDERISETLPVDSGLYPDKFAASKIPTPCRIALEGINDELSHFFTNLNELKHKILANDTNLIEEEATTNDQSSKHYHTLLQELREHESLLDQWQDTHSPETRSMTGHDREMAFLLAFRELIKLLKNPQAAEVVYRIQSFVKKAELWDLPIMLKAVATRDRPGGKIQDFIRKLVEQMKHSEKLGMLLQGEADNQHGRTYLHVRDASGLDPLHEVLEAFLMEKLYRKTLTPSESEADEDNAFHDRMNLLGFVTFKHLDLPVPKTLEQEQMWLYLASQLEAITRRPSPRRKMDGVLRMCQDLTTFLKTQNNGRFPSADEFLPALIYIVLRANPRELKRNVAFILEYRNPAKLISEPGYFFTHLVSSIAFLEEVDCSRLTISPEEFEEGLHRSKERLGWNAVHCEIDHKVVDDTISDRTISDTTIALQQESRKQNLFPHYIASCNEVKAEASFRLPTVLDVRAKRLGLMPTKKPTLSS